ncbi:MAG: c-type cytochrome [Akkermansiaceae bacterium]
MKLFPILGIYASTALMLIAVVSCKSSSEDSAAEAASEKEEPVHPGDWEPEDPELVAGKKVYSIECGLCHDEAEEGAPMLSSVTEWEERKAKGFDVLLAHAIDGYTGPSGTEMPARGGNPDLTDEQMTQAVKYMLAVPR